MACWGIADPLFVSKKECVICSHVYSHAPALLNISTGRIDTLDVYDYSIYDPTVPAEYQTGGYAVILPLGDFSAIRMTNPWYVEVRLPEAEKQIAKRTYCTECETMLKTNASGFAILDLGIPGEPVIHPLTGGSSFSFRYYVLQMTDNKLTVTGTLELPEDNQSYIGYPPY